MIKSFLQVIMIKRLIMIFTKSSGSGLFFANNTLTNSFVFFRNYYFRPINIGMFGVIYFNMVALTNNFKIFNSIICFNMVFVMDFFIWTKRSFQVLFHNISVLKNSFAIDVYSQITIFSDIWFIPIRIKIIFSPPPFIVQITQIFWTFISNLSFTPSNRTIPHINMIT